MLDGSPVMTSEMLNQFINKNASTIATDSEGWTTFLTTSEYQLGFATESMAKNSISQDKGIQLTTGGGKQIKNLTKKQI